jgi:hypothetical protein
MRCAVAITLKQDSQNVPCISKVDVRFSSSEGILHFKTSIHFDADGTATDLNVNGRDVRLSDLMPNRLRLARMATLIPSVIFGQSQQPAERTLFTQWEPHSDNQPPPLVTLQHFAWKVLNMEQRIAGLIHRSTNEEWLKRFLCGIRLGNKTETLARLRRAELGKYFDRKVAAMNTASPQVNALFEYVLGAALFGRRRA